MKLLYLDTSSKYLSLAVAEDEKVLRRIHRPLDRKHSLQLVPLIAQLLKKAKLSLKKLDGLCVGKGPGSFTGLRVGITTIKGLAFVLGKPVVAISSLDILAQNAKGVQVKKNSPLQVVPLVDAKQNKVYACLYQSQNGQLRRKSGYLLLPIDELLNKLQGEIFFLGDAIPLYREILVKNRKIKASFAEERAWYPKAAQAVPLALKRFQEGKFDDVDSLTPLYLYPKECQVRK